MERSGSQKALKVISIIDIVFGVLGLLAGIMAAIATGVIDSASPSELAEMGMTADSQGTATALISVLAISSIFSAIVAIIQGVLGIRASNNNQKILPVWILSIVGLVNQVANLISYAVRGTLGQNLASGLLALALSALTFWIANNIKKEAGR